MGFASIHALQAAELGGLGGHSAAPAKPEQLHIKQNCQECECQRLKKKKKGEKKPTLRMKMLGERQQRA